MLIEATCIKDPILQELVRLEPFRVDNPHFIFKDRAGRIILTHSSCPKEPFLCPPISHASGLTIAKILSNLNAIPYSSTNPIYIM